MVTGNLDGEHTTSIMATMATLQCGISALVPIYLHTIETPFCRQRSVLFDNHYHSYFCQPIVEWLYIIQLSY